MCQCYNCYSETLVNMFAKIWPKQSQEFHAWLHVALRPWQSVWSSCTLGSSRLKSGASECPRLMGSRVGTRTGTTGRTEGRVRS